MSLAHCNSVISVAGGSVHPLFFTSGCSQTTGIHKRGQTLQSPSNHNFCLALSGSRASLPSPTRETDRALHLTRDLWLLRPLQLHCSGLSEQCVEGLAELCIDISPCVVLMIGGEECLQCLFSGSSSCSSDKLTWHALGSTLTQRIRQEQEIC